MGVSKNRGVSPKMDGENNGSKPYKNGMIWGLKTPIFWFNTQIMVHSFIFKGWGSFPSLVRYPPIQVPSGAPKFPSKARAVTICLGG